MNTVFRFAGSVLLVGLILGACSSKKETTASDTWAEMDSFHEIMAASYHPLKDSANLAPAKANAEAMALEAEKWAGAPLPEKVNNDEVKGMLEILKSDTKAFAEMIKVGASDAALASTLTALHDNFHRIQEAWHKDGHEEHH